MKNTLLRISLLFTLGLFVAAAPLANAYDNFRTAIYCPVLDVEDMADEAYLDQCLAQLQRYFILDKVYLETHRRNHLIDEDLLRKVKAACEERGIATAGGITTTGERAITGRFGLFCYTSKEDRAHFEEVVRLTARNFDEVIIDDFYFTDCRCEECIAAKGDRSWPEFRTELMAEVSRNIVMKAARDENPDVEVVIKYPNWYDFYQYTGYNLKDQPGIFDRVYTGTETRDPVYTHQHLQPYQGYLLMRYLENVAPGRNGGGWVDPLSMGTLNRYGEQLLLTLIAKADEMMLFRWGSLLEWVQDSSGGERALGINAAVAGYVFEKADTFLAELGEPIGLPVYKPVNSPGEPFLAAYLGMLGIPVELVPEWPKDAPCVLLTESSAFDPRLLEKMKRHLSSGRDIVMTSGLLRSLKDKGIEDITTISWTEGKVHADAYSDHRFSHIFHGPDTAVFPLIAFPTNDAWMEVTAISGDNSYPLVAQAEYGGGLLRVLAIPEDFADLYKLPEGALTMVKELIPDNLPVRLEGPAKVGLFLYDNKTCIVHSFLPHSTRIRLLVEGGVNSVTDLLTGESLPVRASGDGMVLETGLSPYSYRVLSWSAE